MVLVLGPQSQARAIAEPETTSLRLLHRNLQPLLPPDPLDALVVHRPAGSFQQCRDTAVAVAAELGGQRDDVGSQSCLIMRRRRHLALCRAMLAENPAGPPLRHAKLAHHMLDTGTAAGGAYQFPLAASVRMSLSSVRSETARLSRAFSVSSSFRRFT